MTLGSSAMPVGWPLHPALSPTAVQPYFKEGSVSAASPQEENQTSLRARDSLGKMPAQISINSPGKFLPENRAKRSCDTSRVDTLTSSPSLPHLSPSRPQPTASQVGQQGAWCESLPPTPRLHTQPPTEKLKPLDKQAVTHDFLALHTDTATSVAGVSLRSAQSPVSNHPPRTGCCVYGVSKEVFANRPICPHENQAPLLPCEVTKPKVPEALYDGLLFVLSTSCK